MNAAAAVLLAVTVATVPVSLTPADQAAVEDTISRRFKDPEAARFRDIMARRELAEDFIYVCGYVNAKNAFGGYVGYSPFAVILTHGARNAPVAASLGVGSSLAETCRGYGIVLPP